MSFKYYLRTELELETEPPLFSGSGSSQKGRLRIHNTTGSNIQIFLWKLQFDSKHLSFTSMGARERAAFQNFASLSGQTRSAPTPPRLHSSPLMVQAGARDGPASYRRSQLPAKATHSKSVAAEQLYLFILRMHCGFCFAGYPDGCLSGHLENSKANQF